MSSLKHVIKCTTKKKKNAASLHGLEPEIPPPMHYNFKLAFGFSQALRGWIFWMVVKGPLLCISFFCIKAYIVGCRGASQLGGSLLGIPPGYKANKLYLHEVS